MRTTLTIRWEGSAPGLEDHRLSLSAWLRPLEMLLISVRRMASAVALNSSPDDAGYGQRGGRYAKEAEKIDLEIAVVAAGSLEVEFVATGGGPSGQAMLFPDLPEGLPAIAIARVMDDIDAESKGISRNGLVRRYLRELPDGLRAHDYALKQDHKLVRQIRINHSELRVPNDESAIPPAQLPRLLRVTGRIVAVGFSPWTVSIRSSDDDEELYQASREQVDASITLRDREVVAMCLVDKDVRRLIWVHSLSESPAQSDPEARTTRFLTDWRRTLELLS